MKRGKPLKRRSGLKTRKRLEADPEKVREFLRRGRELERSGFKRARSGFRRASSAEGPLTPREWWLAVFEASGGRCVMTGTRARDADDPRFHAHHPLAKRILRERGLLGHVWDPRNALWLRADVHAAHEQPGVRDSRVPAEKLGAGVWAFCSELDALEGSAWATELVLRAHPPAGSSRDLSRGATDGEGQAG